MENWEWLGPSDLCRRLVGFIRDVAVKDAAGGYLLGPDCDKRFTPLRPACELDKGREPRPGTPAYYALIAWRQICHAQGIEHPGYYIPAVAFAHLEQGARAGESRQVTAQEFASLNELSAFLPVLHTRLVESRFDAHSFELLKSAVAAVRNVIPTETGERFDSLIAALSRDSLEIEAVHAATRLAREFPQWLACEVGTVSQVPLDYDGILSPIELYVAELLRDIEDNGLAYVQPQTKRRPGKDPERHVFPARQIPVDVLKILWRFDNAPASIRAAVGKSCSSEHFDNALQRLIDCRVFRESPQNVHPPVGEFRNPIDGSVVRSFIDKRCSPAFGSTDPQIIESWLLQAASTATIGMGDLYGNLTAIPVDCVHLDRVKFEAMKNGEHTAVESSKSSGDSELRKPPIERTSKGTKQGKKSDAKFMKIAHAMFLKKDDPERPDKEIAVEAGLHPSDLSRSPEYQGLKERLICEAVGTRQKRGQRKGRQGRPMYSETDDE